MIAIVDYGVGNIRNVERAFRKLDMDVVVTRDIAVIDSAEVIILPGVGAYRDAMMNLNKYNLVDCLRRNVESGKLIFGICLGMQLFYEKSYEDGEYEGLGFLKGEIVRFPENNLKVPHMGWNNLIANREDAIGKGIGEDDYVYFVHSYFLATQDESEVIFWSDYGVKVPAVVRQGNIIGMQFHPEKSGDVGVQFLKNIKAMIQ